MKIMTEIENGYVKTYRSMLNWEWHDDPFTLSVFFHCLLLANWKNKRWHGKTVNRGSFITSFGSLAKTCGVSVNTCRKCCQRLVETGELSVISTKRYTMITVRNYEKYQVETGSDMHADMHAVVQADMQGDVHHMHNTLHNTLHTTEERKNSKKEEIINIVRFLNEQTGKAYQDTANRTVHLIELRMAEGYTVEDFYRVITNKCRDWKNTKMEQYLRPSTLFGSKFESYLNQSPELPTWYTSEPVRNPEQEPATQEEIEKAKEIISKGVKQG